MKMTERIKKLGLAVNADKSAGDCVDDNHGPQGGSGVTERRSAEEVPRDLDAVIVVRLLLASIAFALSVFLKTPESLPTILIAASALIAGYDVVINAVVGVFGKRVMNESLLMTIAAAAAFCIGEMREGAAVIVLFQIGRLLQSRAAGKSRRRVELLMDSLPDSATVLADGGESTLPARELKTGDVVVIEPGERVPADCEVTQGDSDVDMSPLTGESLPVGVAPGSRLFAGSVNISGTVQAAVNAPPGGSVAARTMKLARSESAKKGPTESLAANFAKIYTPVIVTLAVLTAVFLPLLTDMRLVDCIKKACGFLVIACPGALTASVPLAFFAGIGGALGRGVLFKSSGAMDDLSKVCTVVFDKTGTLTTGKFRVAAVKPVRSDAHLLLKIAAHAEGHSNHPIARAIVSAYNRGLDLSVVSCFKEHAGLGVTVIIDGQRVAAGNQQFIEKFGVDFQPDNSADLTVYVLVEKRYAGCVLLADTVKPESVQAVRDLIGGGERHVALVSGDSRSITSKMAQAMCIGEYYAECLPNDKVRYIHGFRHRAARKGTVAFVGDGIDDAPVLEAADVGIAMGGLGSEAAVGAADVVIMDENPARVLTAINAAVSTRAVVLQNVAFALAVKLVILLLSAALTVPLWLVIFADAVAALLAILNSMRAYKAQAPARAAPPEDVPE